MDSHKLLSLSHALEAFLFAPYKLSLTQLLSASPYFPQNQRWPLAKFSYMMKQLFDVDDDRLWWMLVGETSPFDSQQKADEGPEAKCILLVLILQLVLKEKRDLITEYNDVAASSPRNRGGSSAVTSLDLHHIEGFIKENICSLLKVLSSEPEVEDPFLEPDELQPFSCLLSVEPPRKLAQLLPIYSKAQKLKASTIGEHIANRLGVLEDNTVTIEGLSFSVTIKDDAACANKHLRIVGCKNSEIFVNVAIRSVHIVGCSECVVYVAACSRTAFVDKCDKLTLSVAARQLRISNTNDSSVFYFGVGPTVLAGYNHDIRVGPHNCGSPSLRAALKAAYLDATNRKCVTSFREAVLRASVIPNPHLMSVEDFNLLALPEEAASELGLVLAPQEYVEQLQQMQKSLEATKKAIAAAAGKPLPNDSVRRLHDAIQGHFREWLLNKGHAQSLDDLVKMLDRK